MGAINLMGIELEGAWKGKRYKPPFKDAPIKYDGSVHFQQSDDLLQSAPIHFRLESADIPAGDNQVKR